MKRNDDLVPRVCVGIGPADGSKMCTMQVISWANGDTTITDLPDCSARPLTCLVQIVNDNSCTHRDGDLLCPDCSRAVLDLGWATVGTTGAPNPMVWAWLAELLDDPVWGVAQHTDDPAPVVGVADLCRRIAAGDAPGRAEWESAHAAAHCACIAADDDTAAFYAYMTAINAITGGVHAAAAAHAASSASIADASDDRLTHARHAITAWRRLTGLGTAVMDTAAETAAMTRMAAVSP